LVPWRVAATAAPFGRPTSFAACGFYGKELVAAPKAPKKKDEEK
jgi:hypothetical protein